MAETLEGVTANWKRHHKRGKIKLDDGRQFPFTLQDVDNVDHDKPQQIRNNLPVSVVLKEGRVQSVTVLKPMAPQDIPAPLTEPHPGRFLNPYNFVRNL
ncbi:MAG: hypothetical protein ACE5GO_05300, partial [Anaerolineales bacterium]